MTKGCRCQHFAVTKGLGLDFFFLITSLIWLPNSTVMKCVEEYINNFPQRSPKRFDDSGVIFLSLFLSLSLSPFPLLLSFFLSPSPSLSPLYLSPPLSTFLSPFLSPSLYSCLSVLFLFPPFSILLSFSLPSLYPSFFLSLSLFSLAFK